MMISTNDAPTLENVLHRMLHKCRVNKTNPRKEYFKTDIETICKIVREHHGDVEYVADAEALQFRQSLTMTEEDQEFIESVYDELGDDDDDGVVNDM
jgi:Meiotically up-regulated gene 113